MQPPSLQAILSPTSWPALTPPAYDVLVAGAGLGGAVIAQLLAEGAGRSVLVVDSRPSMAEILSDEDRAGTHPGGGRTASGKRRRAAAYLAQFSRCGRCQSADVPCIHPAEPDARIVESLLDHRRIDLLLGVEPAQARQAYSHERLVEADFAAAGREDIVAQAMAVFDQIVARGDRRGSLEADVPIASAA